MNTRGDRVALIVALALLVSYFAVVPDVWKLSVPPWVEATWQGWGPDAHRWAEEWLAPTVRSIGIPAAIASRVASLVAGVVELVTSVPYKIASPVLGCAWLGILAAKVARRAG
jgi:hypothetical protein